MLGGTFSFSYTSSAMRQEWLQHRKRKKGRKKARYENLDTPMPF